MPKLPNPLVSARNLPAIHGLDEDPRELRMLLTLCSAWAMEQWLEPLTKAVAWWDWGLPRDG